MNNEDLKILTRSENYIIVHKWESVFLIKKINAFKVKIGDFYGDPACAYISNDEKYCIVGGYGLIIYSMQEPFLAYEYNKQSPQWKEFYRTDKNTLFIEAIYPGNDKNEIRLVVDPFDQKKGGIYNFNPENYTIKRIFPR